MKENKEAKLFPCKGAFKSSLKHGYPKEVYFFLR